MTAKIKLNAASGGGSISIQAPSSSSNNRVISLPDIADGTLVTSQSTLDATKLSGNLPALNGSALTNIDGGKILQVVQLSKTDTASVTMPAAPSISPDAISQSITPSSSSSKVLVRATLCVGTNESSRKIYAHLYRGGSVVSGAIGDAAGSRQRVSAVTFIDNINITGISNRIAMLSHEYLDSPSSTSSLTYSYRFSHDATNGARTLWINREETNNDDSHSARAYSSITLMEVAA